MRELSELHLLVHLLCLLHLHLHPHLHPYLPVKLPRSSALEPQDPAFANLMLLL